MALNEEQAINYILTMSFENIISKLVNHMGWSKSHALEVSAMYRRFLILKKKYGQEHSLPPSEDIDEFWHMHILDTKRYRSDCDKIFGSYLDHYPYLGIDEWTNLEDLAKAFSVTQRLYAENFDGEAIFEVRGKWAKFMGCLRFLVTKSAKRGSYHYNRVAALIDGETPDGLSRKQQAQI